MKLLAIPILFLLLASFVFSNLSDITEYAIPIDAPMKVATGINISTTDLGSESTPQFTLHRYLLNVSGNPRTNIDISNNNIQTTMKNGVLYDAYVQPIYYTTYQTLRADTGEVVYEVSDSGTVLRDNTASLEQLGSGAVLVGGGDELPIETNTSTPETIDQIHYDLFGKTKHINSQNYQTYLLTLNTSFSAQGDFNIVLGTKNADPNIAVCSVLNAAGTYDLTTDIVNSVSNPCMDITANNVVLDCHGFTISSNNGARRAVRIQSTTNSTLKNCIIENGTADGIYLTTEFGAAGLNAVNNTIRNNTVRGISVSTSAFEIYATAAGTVENNTIINNTFTSAGPGSLSLTSSGNAGANLYINNSNDRNNTAASHNMSISTDVNVNSSGNTGYWCGLTQLSCSYPTTVWYNGSTGGLNHDGVTHNASLTFWYNGTGGGPVSTLTITQAAITPSPNATTSNTLLCNATATDTLGIQAYFFKWYKNGASFSNGSFINGSANWSSGVSVNIANITSASLTIGDNWSCGVLANDSLGNSSQLNSSNTTIVGTPYVNITTSASPSSVIEGEPITSTINLSLDSTFAAATISINVTINGEIHSALNTSMTSWSSVFPAPLIAGTTPNATYTINYTGFATNGTVNYSFTASENVTVYNLYLLAWNGSCTPTLNFTFWDQNSLAQINASITLSLNMSNLINTSVTRSFGDSTTTPQANYTVCIVPSFGSGYVSSTMLSISNGFNNKSYIISNFFINGTNQEYKLYLPNQTNTKFTYINVMYASTGLPVTFKRLDIQQFYPANNSYLTISQTSTNDLGKTSEWLTPMTVYYRFIVRNDDGSILQSFPSTFISCAPTDPYCTENLFVNIAQNPTYFDLNQVSGNCSWNNITGTLSCLICPNNQSVTMNLLVQSYSSFTNITKCSNSSAFSGGTCGYLTCSGLSTTQQQYFMLSGTSGTGTGTVYNVFQSGSLNQVIASASASIKAFGWIFTWGILIVCILIGGMFGIVAGLVLSIIVMAITILVGLTPQAMLDLSNPLGAPLIGYIIICAVIIWRSKK